MQRLPGRKRHIRIKEYGSNAALEKTPEDAYMKMVNSSLEKETFLLHTNENGFIFDPACTEGSDQPVVVMGDSLVESSYIQQGKRFCDVLSLKMKAMGTPRQFLNAGYSGATSLHMLNTMINKVGCRENTAVLLILPSNDTLALRHKGGFWDYSNKRYSPILPVNGVDTQRALQADNLHQLESTLRAFASTANAFGLDLYFGTTPFVQKTYEHQPWYKARFKSAGAYEALIAARQMSNQVMRNVARASRTTLLDLEGRFSATPELFYDDLHLNTAGSAVAADIIYQAIGTDLA